MGRYRIFSRLTKVVVYFAHDNVESVPGFCFGNEMKPENNLESFTGDHGYIGVLIIMRGSSEDDSIPDTL